MHFNKTNITEEKHSSLDKFSLPEIYKKDQKKLDEQEWMKKKFFNPLFKLFKKKNIMAKINLFYK